MMRKLPTHKRDDNDDLRRTSAGAVTYVSRRLRHVWPRSCNPLSRAAFLVCLALLLMLCVVWWQSASMIPLLHHQDTLQAPTAAVLLDGRPTIKPLPQAYPNGATGLHRCDLPSLRYQCDLDASVGCRAYPQLFPMGELLKNWSPEEPEKRPEQLFESICRFNLSIAVRVSCAVWLYVLAGVFLTHCVCVLVSQYELQLAQVFHQMEVPFISYGIPVLSQASERWTSEVCTKHTHITLAQL